MKKTIILLILFTLYCWNIVQAQTFPYDANRVSTCIGCGGASSGSQNPATVAQWHQAWQNTATNGGGHPSSDWLYSIVSTAKKEYIGGGYSGALQLNGLLMKLDHRGNLVWSEIPTLSNNITKYDFSSSSTPVVTTGVANAYCAFWRVTKAGDGNVAVGFIGDGTYGYGILIVEFDDNGNILNGGTPVEIIPPATAGAEFPTTTATAVSSCQYTTTPCSCTYNWTKFCKRCAVWQI